MATGNNERKLSKITPRRPHSLDRISQLRSGSLYLADKSDLLDKIQQRREKRQQKHRDNLSLEQGILTSPFLKANALTDNNILHLPSEESDNSSDSGESFALPQKYLHKSEEVEELYNEIQDIDNGLENLADLISDINNIQQNDENMAGENEAVVKSLTALQIRGPESFSGQDPGVRASDFLRDFDDYLKATNRFIDHKVVDPDDENKQIDNPDPNYGVLEKRLLKQYLKGEAKAWFRNLDPEISYADLLRDMRDMYDLTEAQKHSMRLKVYRMHQLPSESFVAFVNRVRTAGRGLKITDTDIVTVVTQGSSSKLRPFLLMAQPKTISDLLKLPLAREEEQLDQDYDFVGFVDDQCADGAVGFSYDYPRDSSAAQY